MKNNQYIQSIQKEIKNCQNAGCSRKSPCNNCLCRMSEIAELQGNYELSEQLAMQVTQNSTQ